jgi:ribose 5-phosphate isomerase A
MYASPQETTKWIPRSFQKAATNATKDAIKRFVKPHQTIGLVSDSVSAAIIREMAHFDGKETLECIQTHLIADKTRSAMQRAKLIGEDKMMQTNVVFDGADQIEAKFNVIKGGGGGDGGGIALLREKLLHSAANQIVIAAESSKFVQTFSWPVPIEIQHPFAIRIIRKKLVEIEGAASGRK